MVVPVGILFAICCLWLAPGAGLSSALADTIYFYKDERGITHFTDLPTSSAYRPFLMTKERYRRNRTEILRSVRNVSGLHGMDPKLVQAVIEIESGFEPMAESRAGAQGLMQIMPETQAYLGLDTPFDPDANIEAGVRYLKEMITEFGTLPLALAAYNAGPGAVRRYKGIPPYRETQSYVTKVLNHYTRIKKNE